MVPLGAARRLRRGRPVRRTGPPDAAELHRRRPNRAPHRSHLRPPRRHPAGDRAGRGPHSLVARRSPLQPAWTTCSACSTGGPRVVVPRQQTLLASITWSYDLLDETDRAVLRRLAVCPTWFDIDAAEAVAPDEARRTARRPRLPDPPRRQEPRSNTTTRPGATGCSRRSASSASPTRRHQRTTADPAPLRRPLGGTDAGHRRRRHQLRPARHPRGDHRHHDDARLGDGQRPRDGRSCARRGTPGLFGLSRWPELHRACDWLLADRPHGPHWAGAVAAMSMPATMMGRFDVLGRYRRGPASGRGGPRHDRGPPPAHRTELRPD